MTELSIIIPTYNRVRRLRRVLEALERQTVGGFEVVVVSDGSTDGTDRYLGALSTSLRLRALAQPNRGVAAARNAGVAAASGRLVLFLDDDVVPEPNLVAEHLAIHAQFDEQAVVLGPMLSPPGFRMQPWVRWEQAMLMKQYGAMSEGRWAPTPRQFYTGNASLAKRHVLAVGGFDEGFRRAEDVELAYRLADRGLRFVFHPGAVGHHYAERSFSSWLETPHAYGRNDVIFTRQHGQSWLLPQVLGEFYERHALIQWLARACAGRPVHTTAAVTALGAAAAVAERVGLPRVAQLAYSALFNLRYYQGVTEQLGGRAAFLRALDEARPLAAGPVLEAER